MAPALYRPSPAGIAVYPWVNKPDTKFNAEGVYKLGLALEGDDAQALRTVIDQAVQEAFDAEVEDRTPAERKKWSTYAPYEVEEDPDTGNPTGRIVFQFRQNAVIRVEGQPKSITIAIYGADDKPAPDAQIWGGAKVRVMYRPRAIKLEASKKAGVRLDFLKVQVLALAERNAKGGFGEVEGGYVQDDEGSGFSEGSGQGGGGDY